MNDDLVKLLPHHLFELDTKIKKFLFLIYAFYYFKLSHKIKKIIIKI